MNPLFRRYEDDPHLRRSKENNTFQMNSHLRRYAEIVSRTIAENNSHLIVNSSLESGVKSALRGPGEKIRAKEEEGEGVV